MKHEHFNQKKIEKRIYVCFSYKINGSIEIWCGFSIQWKDLFLSRLQTERRIKFYLLFQWRRLSILKQQNLTKHNCKIRSIEYINCLELCMFFCVSYPTFAKKNHYNNSSFNLFEITLKFFIWLVFSLFRSVISFKDLLVKCDMCEYFLKFLPIISIMANYKRQILQIL